MTAVDPLDHLFDALADPTRRHLFTRLVQDGPNTATRLSVGLPVTRQAVVKHLQALADAGLATPERSGREVRYRANPAPLTTAVAWLMEAGARWDRRLARLEHIAKKSSPAAEDAAASPRTLADRDRD